MHQHFELPIISTLTRLTSLTKRNDDIRYYVARVYANLSS